MVCALHLEMHFNIKRLGLVNEIYCRQVQRQKSFPREIDGEERKKCSAQENVFCLAQLQETQVN